MPDAIANAAAHVPAENAERKKKTKTKQNARPRKLPSSLPRCAFKPRDSDAEEGWIGMEAAMVGEEWRGEMRGKGRWDERGGVTEEEEEWSGGKGERERERGESSTFQHEKAREWRFATRGGRSPVLSLDNCNYCEPPVEPFGPIQLLHGESLAS